MKRGCNKSPTNKNIAQKIHSNIALQKVFEWILLFYDAIVCAICYLNLLLLQPLSAYKQADTKPCEEKLGPENGAAVRRQIRAFSGAHGPFYPLLMPGLLTEPVHL